MFWPPNPHYPMPDPAPAEGENVLHSEEMDWCNYQGWRFRRMYLELNLNWGLYACTYGVHDILIDDGKRVCGTNSYTLKKV